MTLDFALIDDRDMDGEMVRYPSTLAFYHGQLAGALNDLLVAEHNREVTLARLDITIRAELSDSDDAALLEAEQNKARKMPKSKLTEGAVKAMITGHPDMQKVERAWIDAKVRHEQLRGQCEALKAKGDMIRSLGARIRAEFEADPVVRVRQHQNRRFDQLRREADAEQADLDLT